MMGFLSSERARAAVRWIILVVAVCAVIGAMLGLAIARTPVERTVAVIVVPHPDDEFQAWSLIEERAAEYTVFVSLTRGEETGFCEDEARTGGLQPDLGERVPDPLPHGRWTPECAQAREGSLLGYLTQMAMADPSIPGDFAPPARYGPLPADGTDVCRIDDAVKHCPEELREVQVWLDRGDRGAVVFFDLGDGDLTEAEAIWAIQAVLDHRADWGMDAGYPVGSLIGAFANDSWPCYSYPHPDHLAVHSALWNVDFGSGPQIGATCFLDPRQRMSAIVSGASAEASFARAADQTRLGAHGVHYGWLHGEVYPLSGVLQNTLFMRFQSFWIRFN